MDADLAAARYVFERWARTPGFQRRPIALAQATWILQDAGEIRLDDVAVANRPFVIAALDLRRGGAWDPAPWQQALRENTDPVLTMVLHGAPPTASTHGRETTLTVLGESDPRPGVAGLCEPLLARLDARQAWQAMCAVVPEAALLGSDAIGFFLAVQWRLQHPGDDWAAHLSKPADPRLMQAIAAELECLDALGPDPAVRAALHQRLTRLSRKQVFALRKAVAVYRLTALALLDPEAAFARLEDRSSLWPVDDATDAMLLVALWLVRERRVDALVTELEARGPVITACEWLAALARAGAVAPETLERIALSFVARIPDWLDWPIWDKAIDPLCHLAAWIGAPSIVDAIGRELEVPGAMLVFGLAGADLARLRQEKPAQTRAFVDAVTASPALVDARWDAEETPLVSSLEAGLAVLRVAAASPIGLDVWHPLSDVLARGAQGGDA